MISTVTTTVVTTVTTITNSPVVVSLGLVATLTLLALLMTREMAIAGQGIGLRLLRRNLSVPVLALFLVFAVIVIVRVLEVIV